MATPPSDRSNAASRVCGRSKNRPNPPMSPMPSLSPCAADAISPRNARLPPSPPKSSAPHPSSHSFPLALVLRGEGWGEGLGPSQPRLHPPVPNALPPPAPTGYIFTHVEKSVSHLVQHDLPVKHRAAPARWGKGP